MHAKHLAASEKVQKSTNGGHASMDAAADHSNAVAQVIGESQVAAFNPDFLLSKPGYGKFKCEYPAGENVFTQDDLADVVFNIQRGKMKLNVVSKGSKEVVISLLPKSSFFLNRFRELGFIDYNGAPACRSRVLWSALCCMTKSVTNSRGGCLFSRHQVASGIGACTIA